MSIIQNIRERGTWIIFGIIAIALIAFILQDGIGRKNRGSSINNIGTVNGIAIEKAAFDEKVDMQVQQYASQGVKREQIIGFQFNQEVDRILFKSEEDKVGITVGNKELSDVLFGDDSPFRQEFSDKATGAFKVNDAKQAIAQIKKSKNKEQINQIEKFYIEPAIENRGRNKYQALIVKGVQLPKWLSDKNYAENNSIANISYVGVPYSSISDSTIKISDDEVASYLKENAAAYQVEESSRGINYVLFNAAASGQDSVNVYNQISALKEEFKNAKDDAAYLNKVGSDIVFYNSYVSKKTLQIPNKDSVLAVGVGNVYGPYIDGRNFTIAKIIGTKQWPDSASVRHILIATVNPQNGQIIRNDTAAKILADSIKNAIAGGASFEAMVAKYSDDGGSKQNGGKYEMFGQGKMVPEFNDFSFDNPVGTKAVVKTEFGYHVMEILKQTPRGPAYKIAYLSKGILPSAETINLASTAAAQFAASSKDQKAFTTNAIKEKLQVVPAVGIKPNDMEIPGIGEARSLVRWVYEKDMNDVSEPFEIGDNYLVAIISNEEKAGLMSVSVARPQVEGILRDKKKAEKIKLSFKGNSLESYASAAKSIVQNADSINFNYSVVPGLGNEPKIVGAAFNKSLINKVSEPLAANSGVFVISVKSVGAKQATQEPTLFREELLQRTRSAFYRSNVSLKKAAKIQDNRSKIY